MKLTRSEKQRNRLRRHYRHKLVRFNQSDTKCGHPAQVNITRKVFWWMDRAGKGKRRRLRPGAIRKIQEKARKAGIFKKLSGIFGIK